MNKQNTQISVTFCTQSVFPISSSWWVSTPLKNISQNGNLPQVGLNIKKYVKPPSSHPCKVAFWKGSPQKNQGNPGEL